MNAIAFSDGSAVIYWSALLITVGAAGWLALSRALYAMDGGRGSTLLLFFPAAVLLSVMLSRLLHWYCHTEQYASLASALFNYQSGGFCMPGLLLGVALAAVLMALLGLAESLPRLLDALAPGAALGIAMIRLGELFGNACRGKLVIARISRQHLPLAAPVSSASGAVEYRFASFFLSFLLLLILFVWLLRFFLRRRDEAPGPGNVAALFLLFFSAAELVVDSTRYDSSFLRSNGFVSLSQIFSGLCILGVLIWYSVRYLRARGRDGRFWLGWLLWFLGLCATGGLEYLVQRHGDWFFFCYILMGLSSLLMAAGPCLLGCGLPAPEKTPRPRKK